MKRIMTLPMAWLMAGAVFFCSQNCVGQDAAEQRKIRISLNKTKYQVLPKSIWNVYVGPNDSAWYCFSDLSSNQFAPFDSVKRIIEKEFNQKAPQILDCRILFFEKNGRVWFSPFHDSRFAFGYDGKSWIERRSMTRFMGDPPNSGKYGRSSLNYFADGKIFFAHPIGVDWFDGKKWGFKLLSRRLFDHMQFLPGPDQKSFHVLCVGTYTSLWRYQSGKWSEVPVPGASQGKGAQYPTMAGVAGKTGICVTGYARAPIVIDQAKATVAVAAQLPKLLKDLGSPLFRVREKAYAKLKSFGPDIKSELETALKKTKDLEVRIRVASLLKALKTYKTKVFQMGPFSIPKAHGIYSDHEGRMIISATSVLCDGRNLGRGSVLRSASGKYQFLPVSEFPCIFPNSTNLTYCGWIKINGGKHAWFSGNVVSPTSLLDLQTMKVAHRIGRSDFVDLVAATRSGRVYVRTVQQRGNGWQRTNTPIGVYTPEAP